jgi:dihydroorotase-like cyclic amidohydrolase
LFFSKEDLQWLGDRKGQVRPILAADDDQKSLWENMAIIDVIASDHGIQLVIFLSWIYFNLLPNIFK